MLAFAQAVFEKTRLRMLRVLLDRELCVCELAAVFSVSQPRMSQHLRILKRAGIVNERRDGKWVYYSANPEAIEAFNRAWQEYLQTSLDDNPGLAVEAALLNSDELRSLKERCQGGG